MAGIVFSIMKLVFLCIHVCIYYLLNADQIAVVSLLPRQTFVRGVALRVPGLLLLVGRYARLLTGPSTLVCGG
jgi:hypothetical protein